jgi:zinc transport system ATP-binding protein
MSSIVIDMKDVWFSYSRHAVLQNISLEVSEQDFLALIGPNGGGKTTLLKLMMGLLKPDRGIVRLFGKAPEQVSHRVGYVPQYTHANDRFPISVFEVVLMGRLHHRHRWLGHNALDRQKALNALEKVEMDPYRDRQIGELSGGQRQRVLIARALATEPEILFLDEPTANVDTHGQTELYEILKALNRQTTIVVVSHDVMMISSYIKSVGCVNETLHYHGAGEITSEMINMAYQCPVELVAHGLPHRVLKDH